MHSEFCMPLGQVPGELLIRGSKVTDLAEAEIKTKGYSDVRSACKTFGVNTGMASANRHSEGKPIAGKAIWSLTTAFVEPNGKFTIIY